MIAKNWSRTYINLQIGKIKHVLTTSAEASVVATELHL